jgi:hypothetical protein
MQLMDADARSFDNPKILLDGHSGKHPQEKTDQLLKYGQTGIAGNTDYGNSAALLRRESCHVGKIQVQCNQTEPFLAADVVEMPVGTTLNPFIQGGPDFVTGGLKNVQRPSAEIFVELESHPTASVGIST